MYLDHCAVGPTNGEKVPDEPRYIAFPCLASGTVVDGKPALNRWSSTVTKGHGKAPQCIASAAANIKTDFPGAQVGSSIR